MQWWETKISWGVLSIRISFNPSCAQNTSSSLFHLKGKSENSDSARRKGISKCTGTFQLNCSWDLGASHNRTCSLWARTDVRYRLAFACDLTLAFKTTQGAMEYGVMPFLRVWYRKAGILIGIKNAHDLQIRILPIVLLLSPPPLHLFAST